MVSFGVGHHHRGLGVVDDGRLQGLGPLFGLRGPAHRREGACHHAHPGLPARAQVGLGRGRVGGQALQVVEDAEQRRDHTLAQQRLATQPGAQQAQHDQRVRQHLRQRGLQQALRGAASTSVQGTSVSVTAMTRRSSGIHRVPAAAAGTRQQCGVQRRWQRCASVGSGPAGPVRPPAAGGRPAHGRGCRRARPARAPRAAVRARLPARPAGCRCRPPRATRRPPPRARRATRAGPCRRRPRSVRSSRPGAWRCARAAPAAPLVSGTRRPLRPTGRPAGSHALLVGHGRLGTHGYSTRWRSGQPTKNDAAKVVLRWCAISITADSASARRSAAGAGGWPSPWGHSTCAMPARSASGSASSV
jgi:hypothetical protein